MTLTTSPKTKDILSYESAVWSAADILRNPVGLKESEWPDYMMPFFALRMVESRLVRRYLEVASDHEITSEEDRIDEVKDSVGFYNSVIIEKQTTLADIVKNDKTFYQDFNEYLNAFDNDLKSLLGIVGGSKVENLNIMAVIDGLRKTNALFSYVQNWAAIDFTPYNNSEITDLEEHIKRKWADMSAETAGEQYTPADVINTISELISSLDLDKDRIYSIYDMTCGGANMLFGVEDCLKRSNKGVKTETYGQELRGSLFSLARIESMFRKGSYIEHGNTLTNDRFPGKTFSFGVANPPYGVDWKNDKKAIIDDQTGRFGHGGYPSTSDGQLLFVQHMISKIEQEGRAFIVLNGSPLFSGDAGSGESNIRKWILDNDYLEALIQLPNNEFFNTGITTYIWCLNKNKLAERKDKILCINAEEEYAKLKKNKGSKSREILPDTAKKLAQLYKNFSETTISKVLNKFDFYYNRQKLQRLEVDAEYGFAKTIEISQVDTIHIHSRDPEIVGGRRFVPAQLVTKEDADSLNLTMKQFDPEEESLIVVTGSKTYTVDANNCVLVIENNTTQNLGYGELAIKATYKKANTKSAERVELSAAVEPVWTSDEEKIPFDSNPVKNKQNIDKFMTEWVSTNPDQYRLGDCIIGVEINFNSVFPKKLEIRSTSDILLDLAAIDAELMGV